ncbi:MAG: glycosyltransferase family 25 protein [Rhodobacteraceae bacterium]|nr:glycosyltransferase family 25 protein [Paracoccaceae bacterium]
MTDTGPGQHPIYFINLDRAPERAAYMTQGLSKLGLAARVQRLPAVDARKTLPRHAYAPSYKSIQWRMDVSEFACLESHRLGWQKMLDEGAEHAVILEDDLVFSPGFGAALDAILRDAPPFDCIKLDGIAWRLRLGPEIPCGDVALRPLLQLAISAAAYVISRRGAQKMLAQTESYRDPVDLLLFDPRPDWTQYQAVPALCAQAMLLDEADLGGVPDSLRQSHRVEGLDQTGPQVRGPWWWRTRHDLRGTYYRLKSKLWRNRRLQREGGVMAQVGLLGDVARYR